MANKKPFSGKTTIKYFMVASLLFSILTIVLLFISIWSTQWKTLEIDQILTKKIILSINSTSNFSCYTKLYRNFFINLGITRGNIEFGPSESHEIPANKYIGGVYASLGISILLCGFLTLQTTCVFLNMDNPRMNSVFSKKLSFAASVLLRTASGIILSGMVIYTINEIKERDKNVIFLRVFMEYLKIVFKNYGLRSDDLLHEKIKNNTKTVQEVESLKFRFGKCFFMGWSASIFSVAAGVFAWLVAEQVNKRTKRKKVRISTN